MAHLRPLVRDEHGFVLPTRMLALCVSAVAVAALVFIANDPDTAPEEAATPVGSGATESPSPSPTPSPTPTESTTPKAKPKPKPLKRGEVLVEVFNNTRIKGLAGGVAAKAQAAGWNVLGSDNWYGTVDSSTVYYPPRLKVAGKALAADLGIAAAKPAEEPMRFDRLTVILTEDYS